MIPSRLGRNDMERFLTSVRHTDGASIFSSSFTGNGWESFGDPALMAGWSSTPRRPGAE